MNKISKKIVALVTMAAFVLTLVPFAAFAAAGTVDDSTARAVVVNGEKATVSITVGDTDLAETANLVVWATKSGDASDAAIAQSATTGVTYGNEKGTTVSDANWNDAVVLAKPAAAGTVSVDVTFAEEGDYIIYAALNEKVGGANDLSELQLINNGIAFTRDAESDRSKSDFGVVENNKVQSTATVDVNEEFDATFLINDAYADMTTTPLPSSKAIDGGAHLYVWAIDNETNDKTSYFKINGNTVGVNNAIDLGQVVNGQDVTVTFTRDGNYTLYAGVGADPVDAMDNKLKSATTITVNDNTEINSMVLTTNRGTITPDPDNNMFTLDLTDSSFLFNGSDVCTLSGTVTEKDGSPAKYQDLSFSTSRTDVIEFVKDSANTGNDGKFTLKFSMQSQKNGIITIKDEKTGTEYTVRIIASVTSAQDIDRTANNGTILAGDDDYWTEYNRFFDDAVGFAITDDKGDAVTGDDAIANEPAADANDPDHDTYVRIMDKPSKSTLTADNLELVANGDEYTLFYVGNDPDHDLIAGEYTVRVSLLSNDNATVSFTAKAFGKVSDVEIGLAAVNYNDTYERYDFDYSIDDEVVLGTTVRVTPLYVDENGIKIDAAANSLNFNWYAESDAHAVQDILSTNFIDRVFTLKGDTIEHQTVVGSTITVTVYDMNKKQYKEKTVTIVDSYNDYDLSFDPTTGAVNDDNNVNVTVVEKDGDTANKVNGALSAYIVKSSNEDAKVTVDTKKNVEKGKGALTIYSDKETTVKVQVVVQDEETGKLIGETLEYTVGKEDPLADRTVVMTIGSTEYVVNNNIVVGDAAPFVDSNWRTMVPIRALAESFDAEVIWNNSDRTVTINFDGATQIVMSIGDDTYTVNGAEQTMDTEPVIQGDRTYVPIRFAAEGMGFSVTPLYNSNGLTGSVVFQR